MAAFAGKGGFDMKRQLQCGVHLLYISSPSAYTRTGSPCASRICHRSMPPLAAAAAALVLGSSPTSLTTALLLLSTFRLTLPAAPFVLATMAAREKQGREALWHEPPGRRAGDVGGPRSSPTRWPANINRAPDGFIIYYCLLVYATQAADTAWGDRQGVTRTWNLSQSLVKSK